MCLKAVHLILLTGPAGLIDLTKGSHQMFGGILPFVERGPRWVNGASIPFRYPLAHVTRPHEWSDKVSKSTKPYNCQSMSVQNKKMVCNDEA
jgi:hypothetical protein